MEKFVSGLNRLYKLDNSVVSLLKKLVCLDKLNREDSLEYKRYLNYLDMVVEEERNYLREICKDDNTLDLLIFLHLQNAIRNPNFMLLAITEPFERLNVNRIYYLLLDLILEKHNTSDGTISFEHNIEALLKLDIYVEFLMKINHPELKYKMAYVYPPLEEKLLFNGFNLKESKTPELLIQFFEEQPGYEHIRKNTLVSEFVQTFQFLIAGYGAIDNFDLIMSYLRVVLSKLNSEELTEAVNLLSINYPKNQGLIEEITQLLGNNHKKLD